MTYPIPPEDTGLCLIEETPPMSSLPTRLLSQSDLETLIEDTDEINAAPLAMYESGENCVAMILLKIRESEYICCFDPADEHWHKLVSIQSDELGNVHTESSMLGVAKWGDKALDYLQDLRDHLYQNVDAKPTYLIDIVTAAAEEL